MMIGELILRTSWIILLFASSSVWALTVTNLNDSGAGSLRQAISDANSSAGDDTINFSLSGTITLASALPSIANNGKLTIDGSGKNVVISGDGKYRVFYVDTSAALELIKITVTNGYAVNGGGLFNSGGNVLIRNSTFSNNTATSFGGAVAAEIGANTAAKVEINSSTFSDNTSYDAGGVGSGQDVEVWISNSTFNGNYATHYAAAMFAYRTNLHVLNSTIAGNSTLTWNGVGGLMAIEGSMSMGNTILNGNGIDCWGLNTTYYKAGPNIGTCRSDSNYSIGVDPKLNTLADNGGPTLTMALQSDSPAIDAGDNTLCATSPVSNLDQRGIARPQGTACDIGAYELVQTPPVTIASTVVFYDAKIANNGLYGIGSGKSWKDRPKALRNQLMAAGSYIVQSNLPMACTQLTDILKRINTTNPTLPSQFVAGTAAPDLSSMVQTLKQNYCSPS